MTCLATATKSTPQQHSELSSSRALDFIRFVENAKYRLLSPLRLDAKFQDIVPLIVIATRLVELGWLWNVRDLETYLLCVSKVMQLDS